MSCGVGRRCGSDLELLWLWRRPAERKKEKRSSFRMITKLFGYLSVSRACRDLTPAGSSNASLHQRRKERARLERRVWGIISMDVIVESMTVREITQENVQGGKSRGLFMGHSGFQHFRAHKRDAWRDSGESVLEARRGTVTGREWSSVADAAACMWCVEG